MAIITNIPEFLQMRELTERKLRKIFKKGLRQMGITVIKMTRNNNEFTYRSPQAFSYNIQSSTSDGKWVPMAFSDCQQD